MATEELGRRERKRRQTRDAIEAAALELFSERGFDHTTVSEIAERADVSRRTFFAHFPAKEDVLFAEFPDLLASFREHLASRGPDETTFDALRTWLRVLMEEKGAEDEATRRCKRDLVAHTPQLAVRGRALQGQFVELIAAEAARDLGVDRDDLRAQLVGSAATTALAIVETRAVLHDDPSTAFDQLDQAITFLRGGLEALRARG